MSAVDVIAQTLLEHTFTDEGECMCGYVGHGPQTAAEHVARQIEAVLTC